MKILLTSLLIFSSLEASLFTVISGSLRQFIREYPTPGADSAHHYVPPNEDEIAQFRVLINHVLDGNYGELPDAAAAVGYDAIVFSDTAWNATHIVLAELGEGPRTWRGIYAFPLNPAKELAFEAPHPIYDKGTKMQATDLYIHTRARALCIAGTHRNNLPGFSDMAHVANSFFQAAHEQIHLKLPKTVAVSVHGMDKSTKHDICISNGSKQPAHEGALSNRVAAAMRRGNLERKIACHQEPETTAVLAGTSNVQGRFSNERSDPESERFLHLEQSPAVRAGPDSYRFVIDAFMEQFDRK